jgi:thioredoxin-like negative regulator of GroEL
MLIERLLILLTVILVGALLYGLWRLLHARRLQQLVVDDVPAMVRQVVGHTTGPAILYFTAEDCTQCRYRQSPILSGLGSQQVVTIHAIDAPSRPDLVGYFGIMTVPSTVVLTDDLRPVAVNHGLATLPQLQQQIDGRPTAS